MDILTHFSDSKMMPFALYDTTSYTVAPTLNMFKHLDYSMVGFLETSLSFNSLPLYA